MSQSSEASSAAVAGGEIMLFGVRVKVDPMRKSVSMNNLSQYVPVNNANLDSKNEELVKAAAEDGAAAGYASADDAVPQPSNGNRERKRGQIFDHSFWLCWFWITCVLVDYEIVLVIFLIMEFFFFFWSWLLFFSVQFAWIMFFLPLFIFFFPSFDWIRAKHVNFCLVALTKIFHFYLYSWFNWCKVCGFGHITSKSWLEICNCCTLEKEKDEILTGKNVEYAKSFGFTAPSSSYRC